MKARQQILVIEDDQDANNLLNDTLLEEGYEVRQAYDGLQGWEMIQSQLPDLVLLDVMMPNLDGFELCQRIRANPSTRAVPVLLLTAKSDFTDKMKGFQLGSDDYITKPFVINELLARIRAHLRIQHLQRELAISERRYRELIENSPDGILLLSPQGELLFYNARFGEVLKGRTQEPLTGRILHALYPISDLFREIGGLVKAIDERGGSVTRETTLSVTNGRNIYIELVGMPIRDHLGKVVMNQVVVRDITQRRRMEEALLQAEKINALGILTAGIAHEVNNPLTGISNAVQLIRTGGLEAAKVDEICGMVLNHTERIARIVRDLRIFSKPQGSNPEVFSLQEALQETVQLVRYQVDASLINLKVFLPEAICSCFGDKHHLQQVFINLLLNAVQAIEERGRVTVRLTREGERAVVTVEDTGRGIPSSQLGRVFDPFFTTKQNWRGTGLGLAVSYRIVQIFKGTISVRSQEGRGTTFTLSLPLYVSPAADVPHLKR